MEWIPYLFWWILFLSSISIFSFFFPFWMLFYLFYSVYRNPSSASIPSNKFLRQRKHQHFMALPRNCTVLSNYQISMWFSHLLGLLDMFYILSRSWKYFLLEFLTLFSPPYEFLLCRIKEPPDGAILLILDLVFILGHFLWISSNYGILLLRHYSSIFTIKGFTKSSYGLFMLCLRHLPSIIIRIFSWNINVILRLYLWSQYLLRKMLSV